MSNFIQLENGALLNLDLVKHIHTGGNDFPIWAEVEDLSIEISRRDFEYIKSLNRVEKDLRDFFDF